MMMLKPLCFAALLAALQLPATAALPFDSWAEQLAQSQMRADPNQATARQYLPAEEQLELDGRLTPQTRAYRLERREAARQALDGLSAYDRKTLAAQQRSSAALIEWSLRMVVQAGEFDDFDFPFNQFRGMHVGLVNFLSQAHPIRTARDVDNYLARLGQVAEQIDAGIVRARASQAKGFLMPRFINEAAIGQFKRFLADAPAQNVLVASLAERLNRAPAVDAPRRAAALASAEKLVAESVMPAFRRAQALLEAQLPMTTADAGLWRLPGGDKAYAFELRRNTTTDYTPQQVHAIGRAEVARIEGEMDTLLAQLGYKDGDIEARYERLEADLQPKDAAPQAAMLARFEAILRDAEQRSKLVFDITPRAPLVVKREPPFTEKTAAAHYSGPSRDGTRPGIFWAPLPGPTFRIADMRTLAYHEGVPGHHFQIALQQETDSLPRYRSDGIFAGGSAYSEGWALYAERLAVENGWYEGDVQGRIGQLHAELFRARRLVVDTGLHAMKWTRQQAIAYGVPAHEVDRYVVIPGQACAYKIGQLKILDLRAKAQKALGDKFQIKQFHNLLLQTGNVPLAVLEQVVADWVKSLT